ncbi:L-lactate dehydrogenase (cytochrome), partial [Phenoliferia sp. Uapishka_3]
MARDPLLLEGAVEAPLGVTAINKETFLDGAEVSKHNSAESTWVVISGLVYDVTTFLENHPGGAEAITPHAGKDVTALFNLLHANDTLKKVLSQIKVVGPLDPKSVIEVVRASEDEDELEERRSALPPSELVINLAEFATLAKELLGEDSRPWRYFSSWSDDGTSYDATAKSFSFLRFIPRVNIPVTTIDTSTTFFGATVPIPIFMAPTGQNRQGHPEGEFNHVRAACKTGIPQGVSNGSSIPISDILDKRNQISEEPGMVRAPVWWQIYIRRNRKDSEDQIKEAVAHGADAILITVDVAAMGKREADARVVSGGKAAKKDGGIGSQSFSLYDSDLTWADIAWVQTLAPGVPVLVKGIGAAADVVLAKQHGAAGVILSNHGGRQLDGSPPPLATLIRLRRQAPALLKDPKFEVFIDGGVRRGTDVLKALCLGARGVGLGRPIIYAQLFQTCYGEEGILRAFEIVTEEINTGMRLLGARSINELRPEMVELIDGLVGQQMS